MRIAINYKSTMIDKKKVIESSSFWTKSKESNDLILVIKKLL